MNVTFFEEALNAIQLFFNPKCELFPLPENGLYKNILSNLNWMDIQRFAMSSQVIGKSVILAATSLEIDKIKKFVSDLLSKLNKEIPNEVRENLIKFESECHQHFDKKTLVTFKKSAAEVMRQLLTILKNIDGLEQHLLKQPRAVIYTNRTPSHITYADIIIPSLFKKIMDYAIIYNTSSKEVDILKIVEVLDEQSDFDFLFVVKCAAQNGDLDVALKVKDYIFSSDFNNKALYIIANQAIKKVKYDLALRLASIINLYDLKGIEMMMAIYENLEKAFKMNGNKEKVSEMIDIKNNALKRYKSSSSPLTLKAHEQEKEPCLIQ